MNHGSKKTLSRWLILDIALLAGLGAALFGDAPCWLLNGGWFETQASEAVLADQRCNQFAGKGEQRAFAVRGNPNPLTISFDRAARQPDPQDRIHGRAVLGGRTNYGQLGQCPDVRTVLEVFAEGDLDLSVGVSQDHLIAPLVDDQIAIAESLQEFGICRSFVLHAAVVAYAFPIRAVGPQLGNLRTLRTLGRSFRFDDKYILTYQSGHADMVAQQHIARNRSAAPSAAWNGLYMGSQTKGVSV